MQLGQGLGPLEAEVVPEGADEEVVPLLFCGNARVSRAVGINPKRLD